MKAALICRKFGWTWQEYESQPDWFVDEIVMMFSAEAEENERRNKQNN